jgi:hypothetical protein
MSRLRKVRPELNLPKLENMSVEEVFQNQTLRPILKMQHDILLGLCFDFFSAFNPSWKDNDVEKLKSFVEQQLSNNKNLRNQIIGMVIGQFTTEELCSYLELKKELNKRIVQMSSQRITDTLIISI